MSNTSSAISMPVDEEAPRRGFPWRAFFVLLLLILAAGCVVINAAPAIHRYREAAQDDQLSVAGLIAEETEDALIDSEADDPNRLAEAAIRLFRLDPSLAYVRIWSNDRQLRCEYSRLDTETPRAGSEGMLQGIDWAGARQVFPPLLDDPAWRESLEQLAEVQRAQGEVSDDLAALDPGNPATAGARVELYGKQYTISQLAANLVDEHAGYTEAVRGMNTVLEALADENALAKAQQASTDVEAELSLALETFRARFSEVPKLPAALTASAPPPDPRWCNLIPPTRGRRVLIPLTLPGNARQIAALAGYAEIAFYDPLMPEIFAVARASAYAAIPLALALALLFLRRKKRPAPRYDDEGL